MNQDGTHSEETKLKIAESITRTRRLRQDHRSICHVLFGKPHSALTAEELARYHRLSKTVTYYRRYAANLVRQRQDKAGQKVKLLALLSWPAVCMKCGYKRYIGALDFHHRHPTEKTGKKVTTIEEAQKCDLLCANCHREAHRNMPWKKGGGRPKSASDSLLEPYMRLSGLPDAVITDALSGR